MEGKSTATAPSYVEFEPFCQWQGEEGRDVLAIHVPEFKKEQLRVQINSRGILKISGERSVDSLKKSKFYKEIEVPKYCNANGIEAKFTNGCLYLIMPKAPNKSSAEQTNNKATDDDQKKKSEATEAPAAAVEAEEKPAAEAAQGAGISKKETQNPTTVESADPKDVITKPESSISRMKICAKTSLNIAVAVSILVALGSYAYYKYRSVVLYD